MDVVLILLIFNVPELWVRLYIWVFLSFTYIVSKKLHVLAYVICHSYMYFLLKVNEKSFENLSFFRWESLIHPKDWSRITLSVYRQDFYHINKKHKSTYALILDVYVWTLPSFWEALRWTITCLLWYEALTNI